MHLISEPDSSVMLHNIQADSLHLSVRTSHAHAAYDKSITAGAALDAGVQALCSSFGTAKTIFLEAEVLRIADAIAGTLHSAPRRVRLWPSTEADSPDLDSGRQGGVETCPRALHGPLHVAARRSGAVASAHSPASTYSSRAGESPSHCGCLRAPTRTDHCEACQKHRQPNCTVLSPFSHKSQIDHPHLRRHAISRHQTSCDVKLAGKDFQQEAIRFTESPINSGFYRGLSTTTEEESSP